MSAYESTRVPVADGMRAIAISIIALYHFWQQSWLDMTIRIGGVRLTLLPMLRTGYIMVDMMLMLSAFLLYLPFARARRAGVAVPRTRSFYIKRAIRILPGYIFAVAAPLFMFCIPSGEFTSVRDVLSEVIPYLTFTQTLVPSVYQASRLNAVLWTVGIEVQAYLLFPFAAKAFDRKPITTYVSLLLGGAAYRLAICKTLPDLTLWINQLPSFLDVYANGMLAAWLFAKWESRESARFDRTIQTACTIGACACLFAVWRIICWQSDISWQRDGLHMGQAIIRFPLTALGGTWLLLASRSFSGFQAIFSNKVARWFAGISYALYIWHQLLAVKLREIWRFPPYRAAENPQFVAEQPWQWQYMIVCAAASVMAAALVTYIIERPSVKLLQRFEHSGIQ